LIIYKSTTSGLKVI